MVRRRNPESGTPTPGRVSGGLANLKVTGTTPSSITLGWDGTTGTSYDVLRAGVRIATVTGLSFTDIGLLAGTPYLYAIRANSTTNRN